LVYLNSRFWNLTQLEVVVVELRNERKTSWPTGGGRRWWRLSERKPTAPKLQNWRVIIMRSRG
jgi:hypothetical protein